MIKVQGTLGGGHPGLRGVEGKPRRPIPLIENGITVGEQETLHLAFHDTPFGLVGWNPKAPPFDPSTGLRTGCAQGRPLGQKLLQFPLNGRTPFPAGGEDHVRPLPSIIALEVSYLPGVDAKDRIVGGGHGLNSCDEGPVVVLRITFNGVEAIEGEATHTDKSQGRQPKQGAWAFPEPGQSQAHQQIIGWRGQQAQTLHTNGGKGETQVDEISHEERDKQIEKQESDNGPSTLLRTGCRALSPGVWQAALLRHRAVVSYGSQKCQQEEERSSPIQIALGRGKVSQAKGRQMLTEKSP